MLPFTPTKELRDRFFHVINNIKFVKKSFYNYIHYAWTIDNGVISQIGCSNDWANHAESSAVQNYIASLKGRSFEEGKTEIESY